MATKNPTETKKPLGTYQKQFRVTIAFVAIIILLAIAAGVAYYFVNLDKTSFEQGGVRYRVQEKDGAYVLTNGDGYTCEKTSDGYYVTDDGKVMVSVAEDGTYSIYAAVEGLEDGEEVYNRVAQTILIFPYVSQNELQTLEMHNENGVYTFYRDAQGNFCVEGFEEYLSVYDSVLFSALTTSTCSMIAQDKIIDPITDENGTYSEYGLVGSDTYWYVTTADDDVYKIVLGDMTPSGEGYYVQYVECTDAVLDGNGSVTSVTETPRKAVYIVSPTVAAPTTTSIEYINKPFHEPIESLMTPQIVYDMTMSSYYDVQNFVLMQGDEAFIAFEYIDIKERAHTERSSEPFVMLLKEHQGFKLSTDSVLDALNNFYGMTFTKCVKMAPTEEDLVEYGIYRDPAHTFSEQSAGETRLYYVLQKEDGTYALFDESDELCAQDENGNYKTAGGALIRVNGENGTGETVSGTGTWSYSYTSPFSIYYTIGVEGDDGIEYEVEQFVNFSVRSETETYYAYSPYYGMIVEVAGYELDFLYWDLFDWIESNLFELNVSFIDYIRLELPDGTTHDFSMDNTESQQGTLTPIEGTKYTDANGMVYVKKKVDGVYGLYRTTGPAHTKSQSAHFRISAKSDTEAYVYISYFGMPSGGRSDGWFEGSIYLTSANTLILCDTENGDWYTASLTVASSDLNVLYNNGEKLVDIAIFRKFYESLSYASIEQEHPLTAEEEAALIADPTAFQLRLHIKSAEQDLVFEFYYLTSRKSYIRVSGDGGASYTGGMYILSQRVHKSIADAERLLAGDDIDPTAKN